MIGTLTACTVDTHLGYHHVDNEGDPSVGNMDASTRDSQVEDASTRDSQVEDASTGHDAAADATCTRLTNVDATVCETGPGGPWPQDLPSSSGAAVVYFADGATLPSGQYRIAYATGCMHILTDDSWTVQSVAGVDLEPTVVTQAFLALVVVDGAGTLVSTIPGTAGLSASSGAFDTYMGCVEANCVLAPVDFTFAGGRLGLRTDPLAATFSDTNNGGMPTPTYRLWRLEPCL